MKYIWFSQNGRKQLFDLSKDPHELHDCSYDAGYADDLKCLKGYLTDLLYRRGDGYSDGKELLVGINPRNLLPFMKSKTGTGITEGNWGKTAFAKAIRRTIKPACLLWQ